MSAIVQVKKDSLFWTVDCNCAEFFSNCSCFLNFFINRLSCCSQQNRNQAQDVLLLMVRNGIDGTFSRRENQITFRRWRSLSEYNLLPPSSSLRIRYLFCHILGQVCEQSRCKVYKLPNRIFWHSFHLPYCLHTTLRSVTSNTWHFRSFLFLINTILNANCFPPLLSTFWTADCEII